MIRPVLIKSARIPVSKLIYVDKMHAVMCNCIDLCVYAMLVILAMPYKTVILLAVVPMRNVLPHKLALILSAQIHVHLLSVELMPFAAQIIITKLAVTALRVIVVILLCVVKDQNAPEMKNVPSIWPADRNAVKILATVALELNVVLIIIVLNVAVLRVIVVIHWNAAFWKNPKLLLSAQWMQIVPASWPALAVNAIIPVK